MSLPRYHEYKPSGVEWLGDVPGHWEVLPCRAFVDEQTAKNDDGKNEDYLSLMANVGIIPYAEKGDVGNKKPEDLTKCKLVSKGDFVINSMNYGIGSYGLSALNGICSPVYIVLRPRLEKIESRYAFRIFENRTFQTFAQSFGNGILEHRSAINWDILKSIGMGIPPKEEQIVILNFLDRETAKIDALIAEQRRLVELLAEKRQAVISHAVTKGLNHNAPMKDSGIEWVGEVPKHWEVRRLKSLLKEPLMYGANEAADGDDPGNPRFVRITDINDNGGLREETFRSLPLDIAQPYLLIEGDVLLARSGATVGKSFFYQDSWGSCCFAGYLIRARLNQNVLSPDFFYACCQSTFYWQYVSGTQIQSTIQNVSAEKYANLWLPCPPTEEQQTIAAFLDNKTAKFDALTAEANRAIELLKERRNALISAAVTGKIDVREARLLEVA